MEISVVSSLTPEDECQLATALLSILGGMLELLPIAFSIRIETVSGKVIDRTRSEREPASLITGDHPHAGLPVTGLRTPRPLSLDWPPDPMPQA